MYNLGKRFKWCANFKKGFGKTRGIPLNILSSYERQAYSNVNEIAKKLKHTISF